MPKRDRGVQAGAETLVEKLDVLIRLFALQLARNEKTLADRAVLLNRAGLGPTEIARVCNSTPKSVSVRLARARRRKPLRKPTK